MQPGEPGTLRTQETFQSQPWARSSELSGPGSPVVSCQRHPPEKLPPFSLLFFPSLHTLFFPIPPLSPFTLPVL